MDASWPMILTFIYLILLILSRLVDVLAAELRNLRGAAVRRPKHPDEDRRIGTLLAQYLPVKSKRNQTSKWWQSAQRVVYWLEPIAVVYFFFLVIDVQELAPLLICFGSAAVILLDNVWQIKSFSLRKKLRLTVLLPSQIIPYYFMRLSETLMGAFKFIAKLVLNFFSRTINFPFRTS